MESVTGINTTPSTAKPVPEQADGFVEGPVTSDLIAETISRSGLAIHSGAHGIFLGQVRVDDESGSRVVAIEFSAYPEMALPALEKIRQEVIGSRGIDQLVLFHSTGRVEAGQVCFFVMATAGHRKEALDACSEAVNRIKAEVPVWGKLILENGSFVWKKNS